MPEFTLVHSTGDLTSGSRCVVYGRRVVMQRWTLERIRQTALTIVDEDLDLAEPAEEDGMVAMNGRDVVESAMTILGSQEMPRQDVYQVMVPIAVLEHMFGSRLPDYLRPISLTPKAKP